MPAENDKSEDKIELSRGDTEQRTITFNQGGNQGAQNPGAD